MRFLWRNGSKTDEDARKAMENDPDILAEATGEALVLQKDAAPLRNIPRDHVPLNVLHGAHRANSSTAALLSAAGGLPTLRTFTHGFYEKVFADPHLDKFIRSHDDPHGERFALWIAEKMGHGSPWTEERSTRPVCPFHIRGVGTIDVHDRSSAHFAAWHSPKRDPADFGKHFKLDDCRVWMRLHFWAAREAGIFEGEKAAFGDYYVRFIGHFVSVYENSAPMFARESMRWSADPANIARYRSEKAYPAKMPGVLGVGLRQAAHADLPEHERVYTGSRGDDPSWPYELGRRSGR